MVAGILTAVAIILTGMFQPVLVEHGADARAQRPDGGAVTSRGRGASAGRRPTEYLMIAGLMTAMLIVADGDHRADDEDGGVQGGRAHRAAPVEPAVATRSALPPCPEFVEPEEGVDVSVAASAAKESAWITSTTSSGMIRTHPTQHQRAAPAPRGRADADRVPDDRRHHGRRHPDRLHPVLLGQGEAGRARTGPARRATRSAALDNPDKKSTVDQ